MKNKDCDEILAATEKTVLGKALADQENAELNTVLSVRFAQLLAIHGWAMSIPENEVESRARAMTQKERRALVVEGFKKIYFASTVLSMVETAVEFADARNEAKK